jgi:hypothetical protein
MTVWFYDLKVAFSSVEIMPVRAGVLECNDDAERSEGKRDDFYSPA